jgi:hypothetical protein
MQSLGRRPELLKGPHLPPFAASIQTVRSKSGYAQGRRAEPVQALPRKRWTIALAVALAARPALAAQDYPPGLFENSPVVRPFWAARCSFSVSTAG